MNCIKCGEPTDVAESCTTGVETFRRRKCPKCGQVMYTEEHLAVDPANAKAEFSYRSKERVRASRARKKGLEYEPEYKREDNSSTVKGASRLF
jgi:transcriptional regulator NrdR family protein